MARTVDTIKALFYAEIAKKPDLARIFANKSQAKYWGDIVHTVSVEIALHEQLMDYHLEQVKELKEEVTYNTDWLKARVLEFQYDATTPQVLTLDENLKATYNPIDITKRILSQVVFYLDGSRIMHVKVAKSSPPVKISGAQLTSLQSYLTDGGNSTTLAAGFGFSGIALVAESVDPDYIFLEGEIKHEAKYTSTIAAAVITAIKNFYYNLPVDGNLRTVDLVAVIWAVPGVQDVIVKNLAIRANGVAFGSKTFLVNTYATVVDEVQCVAGYAYEEVTAGDDLATKLTFNIG